MTSSKDTPMIFVDTVMGQRTSRFVNFEDTFKVEFPRKKVHNMLSQGVEIYSRNKKYLRMGTHQV